MGEAKQRGDYDKRKADAITRRATEPMRAKPRQKPSLALVSMLGIAAQMGLLAKRYESDGENMEH